LPFQLDRVHNLNAPANKRVIDRRVKGFQLGRAQRAAKRELESK